MERTYRYGRVPIVALIVLSYFLILFVPIKYARYRTTYSLWRTITVLGAGKNNNHPLVAWEIFVICTSVSEPESFFTDPDPGNKNKFFKGENKILGEIFVFNPKSRYFILVFNQSSR